MNTDNLNYKLLKFIDFHARANNSLINTVNSIVSSTDILSEVVNTLTFLQRDFSIIYYSGKSTDENKFLETLAQDLKHEKTVLIAPNTINFHPAIYSELMEFRENNRFSPSLMDGLGKFPESCKIFLFYILKSEKDKEKVFEISDYILNL
jgi:hypothetical protein